jgi:hypothetical protein
LPRLGRKQMVEPLDQWDYICIGVKLQGLQKAPLHPPPPHQQLDQGSDRSLCCGEEEMGCAHLSTAAINGTGEGMWCVITLAFHNVDTKKPSEASHWRARPIITSRRGHQCSETSLTGELTSIVSVGASQGRKLLPPMGGKQKTVGAVDQWDCVLEWSYRASTRAAGRSVDHIKFGALALNRLNILSPKCNNDISLLT